MLKIFNFLKTLLRREEQPPEEDTSNCLVGVVRNKHQLEINLAKKFYHAPSRLIYTLDMPIKYIAIYKSAAIFGRENAGIFHYGKVISSQSVPRYQITDIPKNSQEVYCVFHVEEWIALERPIKPLETAHVITMTNLALLKKSEYIPELYMRTNEEFAFFQFLKAICIDDTNRKKYNFNGTKIAASEDTIEIIFKNGERQKIEKSIYRNRPFALYRKIMLKSR